MLAEVGVRRVTEYAVGSPYAWDVLESLTRSGATVVCVDNHGGADARLPLAGVDTAERGVFIIGLSSAHARALAAADAAARGFVTPVSVIDPSAVVASTAEVAHGAYLNAGVVVASHARIGCHVNVNRSASIGHDTNLGFAVSVGPGAVISGSVTIESQVFVGAGATILTGLTIGAGAIVAAGAVVTSDVARGEVVAGNPARLLRTQDTEDWEAECPHSSMH
jgi:sugar O-acyltransferase (sialic acid O-acetyltransferase NeuD family)